MLGATHHQSFESLRTMFGVRLQENVRLANYTSARVGGEADGLMIVHSAEELEKASLALSDLKIPYAILGSCYSWECL